MSKNVTVGNQAATEVVPRYEVVLNELHECIENIEQNSLGAVRAISEIYQGDYYHHYGYENFNDFCEIELGISARSGRYYVAIGNAIKNSGLSWEDVDGIGWTKLRTIASLMNKKNAKRLIDLCGARSVSELTEYVKAQKADSADVSPSTVSRMAFSLEEDQAEVVHEALALAKRVIESDNSSLALEHICFEWAQSTQDSKLSLDKVIRHVEKIYGVQLDIVGEQDLKDVLST